MKVLHGICALALVLAVIGCGNKAEERQAATPAEGTQAQPAATESAPGTETAPAATPVTLTGLVGCGHCNFSKTEHCSAAIQTAGGEVYVIDGVTTDSELWKLREENAKNCEIVGMVSPGSDGLNHIMMASYKVL